MSKEKLTSNRLGLKAYLKGKNKKISDLKVFVLPMKKKISSATASLHVEEMNFDSEEPLPEIAMLSEEDVSVPLLKSQSSSGNEKAGLMNLENSDGNLGECDGDISKEIFSDEVESSENPRVVNGENTKSVEMELLTCQRIMTWLGICPEVFAQAALMHNGDVDKAVQWMLFPNSHGRC